MLWPQLKGKVALITGATRGLGFATALELGRCGVQTVLTHKWGSSDEEAIRLAFEEVNAPAPLIICADASREDDTESVVNKIADKFEKLDIFISNVSVTAVGGELNKLTKRAFSQSFSYSSWPLLDQLESIKSILGKAPATIIATSSDGPEHFYPGYDFVAVSKSLMEALALQIAKDYAEDSRVFVLRSRQIITESYETVFSASTTALLRNSFSQYEITPAEFARACVTFCTGLLDGLHGSVVSLDKGAAFVDNTANIAPKLLSSVDEKDGEAREHSAH